MTILGIETSCDETGIGIVTTQENSNSLTILAHSVATSLPLHAITGGIIPEQAAREQVKYILPTLKEVLRKSFSYSLSDTPPPIDAIAVTYGPGLIGSLLVGVETAKTLSYLWNKPIIPVNHMLGHVYANWLTDKGKGLRLRGSESRRESEKGPITPTFPAIALIVSGGHTDLLLMRNHTDITVLGGTRDDAAGEAFDKIGRLLGLPYPAGPLIEQKAKKGDPKRFSFPRPLIGSDDFDFSFSGLKTAVYREVQQQSRLDEQTICDISRGVLDAIIAVIVKKTMKAAVKHQAQSILLSGGVAANQTLKEQMELSVVRSMPFAKIFVPQKSLCTDNGAMIAAAACFLNTEKPLNEITANPQLYYEQIDS